MSKQLNSILNKMPHATATSTATESESTPPPPLTNQLQENKISGRVAQYPSKMMARVSAPVPDELKLEIKKYILENPGETEKSLILTGLRAIGFSISNEYIEDQRKNRK